MTTLEFAQRGSKLRYAYHKRMPRLSPEQREEMVLAYIAGKSGEWLARKYRVHPNYPRMLATKRGYRRKAHA